MDSELQFSGFGEPSQKHLLYTSVTTFRERISRKSAEERVPFTLQGLPRSLVDLHVTRRV